ncbi:MULTISPECIES: inositol monophosphatase family protein [unclassified Paracoccus (in: a-proteobacteria)]|uniref:inositol monophosphatase family protein n=1 Tax=unclassified Paracoccus (in: a-proteobacteria) TaxID=2688777 RepID=UPI001600E1FB|nr:MULTISPECIES: inositol monophosphatase family protein [unclassified Paracoccus (in: a-proteobacteria)]MBB1491729.1 inositol monophosphatase family protein [Paracoccus sp. MC1854]MBB1496823.1 inositol monophosphatase family protein [Paracoccus sp. MC1862]QQO45452.1 inositol monophosphatase family protein [Paracoccus sp. MC1862]
MTSFSARTPAAAAILQTAGALADVARAETLRYFRSPLLAPDNKAAAGFDPVTEADRACERAMRAILAERRPDDAILGEEYGPSPGTSGMTWVLDPIDGTRAYLCGAPTWGVLIGVTDPQGPVYGMIDQPWTGERFEGGLGLACLTAPQGDRPLGVRQGVGLEQATLMTTYPEVGTEADSAAFRRVAARVRLTRYGFDCYAYALLAMGQVDLVIEAGLQPYDIVAPIAVIEAAGGIVTDWQGGPAHGGGRVIAAATPELHAAVLSLLAG